VVDGFQQLQHCQVVPRVISTPFSSSRRPHENDYSSRINSNKVDTFSRLHAFSGGGGFGKVNVNPPIKSRADILQRIQSIVTGTVKQFTTGFTRGYLFGSFWGLVRGTDTNIGVKWACDFGTIAALFSATNSVAQLILALPSKDDEDDEIKKKNATKRQQTTSLWSAVIRNMIVTLYFARHGGIFKMARFAAMYGGVTYYLMSQKNKRFAARGGSPGNAAMMEQMMKQFSQTGGAANMNTGGAANMNPGGAVNMEQLLQQLASQRSATSTTGTPPPSSGASSSSSSSSSPGSSSTKSPPSSSSSSPLFKKDNVVDVEWEQADSGEEGDAQK